MINKNNNNTKMESKMRNFQIDQFVWVDGQGFINDVTADSRSAVIVDMNEDAVLLKFRGGDEDWFTWEQVK